MVETTRQTNYGLPRATYILLLLNSMPNKVIEGRTRLEKLVFVTQKKLIEDMNWGVTNNVYNFRAFNYGPFTEEVLDDIASLEILKLVKVEKENLSNPTYSITEKGEQVVKNIISGKKIPVNIVNEIKKIASGFGKLPLNKLIELVYKEYPDYTGKSLIKSKYMM